MGVIAPTEAYGRTASANGVGLPPFPVEAVATAKMRRNPRRVLKLAVGAVSLILLTAFITKGIDNEQGGPYVIQVNAAGDNFAYRQQQQEANNVNTVISP